MPDDMPLTAEQFNRFRKLVYEHAGISLPDAKIQMVRSRLSRRLRANRLTEFADYYTLLTGPGSADEMREFINCITTNKTDFFREQHHFDFVANTIVPAHVDAARYGIADRCIRIWHAGCSTGEEPYTMAMTLLEALEGKGDWDIRLLASDLDTNVLDTAERGVYDADRVETIPQSLLRKYFLRSRADGEPRYMAKPVLKDLIKFKQINLTVGVWPIRSDVRFDMIFCRNVIIYFDKPTQQRLFDRFSRLLRPGGYLFIGHSESLHGVSDAFTPVGQTIYRLPVETGQGSARRAHVDEGAVSA